MISVTQPLPFNLDNESLSLGQFIDDDQCFQDSYFSNTAQSFSSSVSLDKSHQVDISDDVIDFLSPGDSHQKSVNSLLSQSIDTIENSIVIDTNSPDDLAAASLYPSDQSYSSSPTLPETPSELNHPLLSFKSQSFYINDLHISSPYSSASSIHSLDINANKQSPNIPSLKELALIKSHLSPELIIYL